MDPASTRYIQRDGRALAFQTVGDGDACAVFFMEAPLYLDLMWTDPHISYNFERGTRFARTIYLQRRGFGLSEVVDHVPTLDEQADDVLAVMDAGGMEQALLIGYGSTCGPVTLVAARHPERVARMVLLLPFPDRLFPFDTATPGWTESEREHFVREVRALEAAWGTGAGLRLWAPGIDTPLNRRFMALMERATATPAAMQAHLEWMLRLDYSQALPSVQCPTRVILPADAPVPLAAAQSVADRIPAATLHRLAPVKPGTSMGEMWIPIVDILEEFVTGAAHPIDGDRHLASLLFTDVVGSTRLLARIGDIAYREVRAAHERQVRYAVESAGGRLVNVAGDGTLSVFESAEAALRCADRIRSDAHTLGLQVRAGLHTGAVEETLGALTGMAVHVGARIGAAAAPDEILVSRSVHDLVTGSGLTFADRGNHRLQGVPGRWHLYALVTTGAPPRIPRGDSRLGMFDRAVLRTAKRTPQLLRAAVSVANARQRRQAGNP